MCGCGYECVCGCERMILGANVCVSVCGFECVSVCACECVSVCVSVCVSARGYVSV